MEVTPLSPLVFIPEPIGEVGFRQLAEQCRCHAPWAGPEFQLDGDVLANADAIIVRIYQLDSARIGIAKKLRIIAKHGVGFDNIDVTAATERGIPILYTPGSNANAVAEHTFALLLALARHIGPADQAVRDGWKIERSRFLGTEVAGKVLGIIGLGRIGKRVALKAAAGFGMQVLAFDPFIDATDYPGPAKLVSELDELLAAADFLTLHVPLTDLTRDMLDRTTLAKLKPSCRLINTARGAIVDERALADALTSGQLAGAAIDAFAEEPLPADSALLRAPHVLLTPHIAGQSTAAMEAASRMVAEGVLAALAGRTPDHLVNPAS